MLSRRNLIVGGAALTASSVAPHPASAVTTPRPGLLRFDVFRNSSRIGEHAVRLSRSGTTVGAEVTVELAVSIGPITVFRYTHSVREEWRDGQFQWMESRTNDDGTLHHVRADRTAEGVVVRRGAGESAILTGDAIPLTHWNHKCVTTPLFNPQTGLPLKLTVQPRPAETLDLGGGRMVRTRRFSLVGEAALETWYDETESWVALRSAGRDGSTISYRWSA